MQIRLAAIGSLDFLALLEEVMPEFAHDFTVTTFAYDHFDEFSVQIEQLQNLIDVYLFADQAYYALAVEHGLEEHSYLLPVDSTGSLPSKALMKQVLKTLKYAEKAKSLEKSQLAIQIVQVANFNQLMDKESVLFYDVYRLYLKTQELLLSYTERVLGSFVSIGNGRFMIFSTRGSMEKNKAAAMLLLQQIKNLTHLSANIGMGYGITALEAEKNARLALNYAEQSAQENCMFLVDESGSVSGPLQDPGEMSFKYRTESPELMLKLNAAKVSIATFEKILSVQNAAHQKSITASAVSELLHMSDRNARKILAALHCNGLAEVVGQETPTAKGRPRQIFRVQE